MHLVWPCKSILLAFLAEHKINSDRKICRHEMSVFSAELKENFRQYTFYVIIFWCNGVSVHDINSSMMSQKFEILYGHAIDSLIILDRA